MNVMAVIETITLTIHKNVFIGTFLGMNHNILLKFGYNDDNRHCMNHKKFGNFLHIAGLLQRYNAAWLAEVKHSQVQA